MKRSRAVLAFLLLAASTAAWADWVKVFESTERTYYVDPASVQRNATLTRVWTLMDLKKVTPGGAMSRVALQEFDCGEKRDRILSISEHSWPMAGGTMFFRDNTERAWRVTASGTVNERIRNLVCRAPASGDK